MKRVLEVILISAVLWIAGCNTISGIGRDLQSMSQPYIEQPSQYSME